MNYREEHDALGIVQVPEQEYYGAQTARAMENFAISNETTNQYPLYIHAVVQIKKAAARAHADLGVLSPEIAGAIANAADEILDGNLADQFPINVLQGGGGTSTNMNVNEVLANRANELLTGHKGSERVHPNDHVNMGQSTNDVIPAAVKLMAWSCLEQLRQEAVYFSDCLGRKEQEFSSTVKLGRTCLQDAMPITLGQEFSGYRALIDRCIDRIERVQPRCLELPLGGTAIGTGSGTYEGYTDKVARYLSSQLGRTIIIEENFFDALQNGDIYAEVLHAIKMLAVSVSKIATDFRMLCSGPRAGLNEITLPAVQPGSSIMPGKINPVMPELMNQICYEICGNDAAVTMAVEGGELDLNVWEPLAVKKIASSAGLLTGGLRLFAEKCVFGITANVETCARYARRSTAISSMISAMFNYRTGTETARKAFEENRSIQEVAVEMGLLTEAEAELYLDPLVMTDQKRMAHLLREFHAKHSKG